MPITASQIVMYTSANMPVNDTASNGGAINSGIRVVFDDIAATDVVEASGAAADSGTVTITGRKSDGVIATDSFALSGTTIVSGAVQFERILIVAVDAIASGNIILRDAGTNTTIGTIPVTESGFRRPFYDATANAAGGADKDLYEKIFVMNTHTSLALLTATVTEIESGLYTKAAFALENTYASTQSVTDRTTVPTGTGPLNNRYSHSAWG